MIRGVLGLLLLAAGILAGPAAAQPGPRVEVAPATAAPGETVTLHGSGWPAGAALGTRLYEADDVGGASAPLGGAITVGSDGTFNTTGTLPLTLFGPGGRANLNVVPGPYTLVVNQDTSLSASTPVIVGAPRQGALLWGEVFLDLNGNASRDAGDLPATVLVTVVGPSNDSPPRQAFTDVRGRFALTGVPPGEYQLSSATDRQDQTWTASAHASAADRAVVRADLLLQAVPVAPPVEHDARYFVETGYRIDDDAVWDDFLGRGGLAVFGYPVSRPFRFLGCGVQMFQRVIAQTCDGQGVQLMNVLDPDLFPYTRVNFSTFPAVDDTHGGD